MRTAPLYWQKCLAGIQCRASIMIKMARCVSVRFHAQLPMEKCDCYS